MLADTMTPDLVTLLVAGIIRVEDVMRAAADVLEPTLFSNVMEPHLAVVTMVARDIYGRTGSLPDKTVLLREMKASPAYKEIGGADIHLDMGFMRSFDELYALPDTALQPAHLLDLLRRFLDERLVRNRLQGRIATGLPTEEIFEAFRDEKARACIDRPELYDPLDIDADPPSFRPRVPTGVPFFDKLIGGGTLPGEVHGLLGPTGGGKTLLATQIGVEVARRGDRVLFFSYEENAREKLRPRVLSCASGVPRDLIEGHEWADMDPRTQSAIRAARDALGDRYRILDRATQGESIAEIEATITAEARADRHPRLVIVDWLWPLLTRMAASSQRTVGARTLREPRHCAQAALEELKRLSERNSVVVLLLHQLNTQAAKRRAGSRHSWADGAEATSIAWLLHGCVSIGPADPNGVCTLAATKIRSTATGDTIVILNGRYCRFERPKRGMIFDKARGEFVAEDDMNKLGNSGDPMEETYRDGQGTF